MSDAKPWCYPKGFDVALDCRITLLEDGGVRVSASPGVDALAETERQIEKYEEWLDLLHEARKRLEAEQPEGLPEGGPLTEVPDA